MPAIQFSQGGVFGQIQFRELIALKGQPCQSRVFAEIETGQFSLSCTKGGFITAQDGQFRHAFDSLQGFDIVGTDIDVRDFVRFIQRDFPVHVRIEVGQAVGLEDGIGKGNCLYRTGLFDDDLGQVCILGHSHPDALLSCVDGDFARTSGLRTVLLAIDGQIIVQLKRPVPRRRRHGTPALVGTGGEDPVGGHDHLLRSGFLLESHIRLIDRQNRYLFLLTADEAPQDGDQACQGEFDQFFHNFCCLFCCHKSRKTPLPPERGCGILHEMGGLKYERFRGHQGFSV